jgi:anti-anti-sigma regulatory factor
MNFKTDTKEKFTVIKLLETNITANMTAALGELEAFMKQNPPHLVLNLQDVKEIDEVCAQKLAALQQLFYENDNSFVICEIQENVEKKLEELELLEVMNITPTESEAWDILQMEEIERELMNDFD